MTWCPAGAADCGPVGADCDTLVLLSTRAVRDGSKEPGGFPSEFFWAPDAWPAWVARNLEFAARSAWSCTGKC